MAKKKINYVLSSHWDREWYQNFQDYRHRLVNLLDKIINLIDSGEIKGPFYLDGQSIPLEDYLEIRPNKYDKIKKMIQCKKLVCGPWYVLPDEFLVSGESIIRNIRLGISVVESYGAESSKAGFVCDMFGHISQLPQIFKQFGIGSVYLWRGVNVRDARNVIWEGADGTEIPCLIFGDKGYGDFTIQVRNSFNHDFKFENERAKKDFAKYLESEEKITDIDTILVFDGCDHQFPDMEYYKACFEYVESSDKYEMSHVGLDEYQEQLVSQAGKIKKRLIGEFREAEATIGCKHLMAGSNTSRIDIKQLNCKTESLIFKWAEPFSVFANAICDYEYPQGFLDTAWKWLLRNHAHDSICGCSIDQVHKEVFFRYYQSKNIAYRLRERALSNIAMNVGSDDKGINCVIFNSCTKDYDAVAELTFEIPEDWPVFQEFLGYERIPSFRIYDTDGNEVDYQRLSVTKALKRKIEEARLPYIYNTNDVRVAVEVSVPSMGYTTLKLVPQKEGDPVRHPNQSGMFRFTDTIENDILSVKVVGGSMVQLTDKRNGKVYEDFLQFEDSADIGDGWFRGLPVDDVKYYSNNSTSLVSLVHDGPLSSKLEITTEMQVPKCFDYTTMKRSEELITLKIHTFITLREDSDCLEVNIEIDNTAKDHMLRVVMPIGSKNLKYYSNTAFDIVERDTELPADNWKRKELAVGAKPHQSWTAAVDENGGLGVVTPNLFDTEIVYPDNNVLILTLYRSFSKTFSKGNEPDGQMIGKLNFDFNIVALQSDLNFNRLYSEAEIMESGGLYVANAPKVDGSSKLPLKASMVKVDGGCVLTSLYRFNGKLELRMFNPASGPINSKVVFNSLLINGCNIKKAFLCDLSGNVLEEIKIANESISLAFAPKQILTVALVS